VGPRNVFSQGSNSFSAPLMTVLHICYTIAIWAWFRLYMWCVQNVRWMVPENKQNRRYKQINFIGLQNDRHPSQHTVGNVHKASENCQQRPL
jgi:hypothetical protein